MPDTVPSVPAARGTAANKAGAPAPDDGRKPQNLSGVPAMSWKYVLKRAVNKFSADGSTDLAASLTYYGVLSLFPAILALVSILGIVGQAEQTSKLLLDMVANMTDAKVAEAISGPVQQLTMSRAAGWTLAFGLVTALWSASGYVGAFSRAMNRIYGIDEGRPVWKLRPALLLVTLASVLMVATMSLLLVLSGPVARAVGEAVGVGDQAITIWNLAKWPVVGILAIVLIAVLYYFTPNVRQPKFRWISVGAAFALIACILASAGFGVYVANFSKYEKTYGTIAGVIVLLLWIWIMNLVLLFGAQIDAELERARQLQAGIKAEAQLQLPPRETAASVKKRDKELELIAEGRRLRGELQEDDGHPVMGSPEAKVFLWLAGIGATVAAAAAFRNRRGPRR
ncbi:YihY/virulence factor BrkB family protein [Arthrobacter antibioticus]|uniref:YihY/virulence factor BrkB family protein n=1 Tax=Arthrobacter sp. H35-MC1 TaxID=3046203 RepID=UPI0024BAC18C|nr:YihY/virulence factor BrkB family protein [Arthrobacter sp. H35-MC1]MDJ0315649.1 YihY/virulence factor BrkB family protein [Arthrobacter sp. H35-MC1]